MKKKPYFIARLGGFGERIYLEDVIEINKEDYKSSFSVEINYISDYFRSTGDPNPVFWIREYYDNRSVRDKRFNYISMRLKKLVSGIISIKGMFHEEHGS